MSRAEGIFVIDGHNANRGTREFGDGSGEDSDSAREEFGEKFFHLFRMVEVSTAFKEGNRISSWSCYRDDPHFKLGCEAAKGLWRDLFLKESEG